MDSRLYHLNSLVLHFQLDYIDKDHLIQEIRCLFSIGYKSLDGLMYRALHIFKNYTKLRRSPPPHAKTKYLIWQILDSRNKANS